MSANRPCLLTAGEAASAIAGGNLTSVDLVQSCLDRISERDDTVHAWIYLDPEQALDQARDRDARSRAGPLHGVPVGIKDIIDTADMPTAYGSAACAGQQPARDAACVRLLRQAGAVIMGKTVTTEFAFYAPGATCNPHNPGHTPGGSSSGSAAAVADYHVPLALGTQTAGSILRPASYTGVIGFKPTYDTYSREGIHPLAESMDTLGAFSRDIAGLGLLHQVLAASATAGVAQTGSLQPAAIAFVRTPEWDRAEPAMQQAVENCVSLLADSGIRITEPEHTALEGLADLQMSLLAHGATQSLGRLPAAVQAGMKPQTRELINMGRQTGDSFFTDLNSAMQRAELFLLDVFADAELIITPSAPGEAPAGLEVTGDPVFNRIWTLLRLPCINLPCTRGPGGLPLGVQLVAGRAEDARLLGHAQYCTEVMAYQVEAPH